MSVQSRGIELTPVFLISQADLDNVMSLVRVHLALAKDLLNRFNLVRCGDTNDAHDFNPMFHEGII